MRVECSKSIISDYAVYYQVVYDHQRLVDIKAQIQRKILATSIAFECIAA